MTVVVAGKKRRQQHGVTLVLLATLLGGMLAIGTGVAPASAHAELLDTTPQSGAVLDHAPETAELRFNEPVQLIDGGIRLFPGDGNPTVLTARTVNSTIVITLPDNLGDGSYALSYRVVSTDGHPISGAIIFRVGTGTPTSPVPGVDTLTANPASTEFAVGLLTALQYLGLLVFAGLLFFDRMVLRTRHPVDTGTRRLLGIALGAASVASLLLIPASALRVVGSEPWALFTPGVWLPGVLWQPVASAALILTTGITASLLTSHVTTRAAHATAVSLAAAAVAAPLLIGHTLTVKPGWVMVAADLGHLTAGAYWTGGVIGLLIFLIQARPGAVGKEARTSPEVVTRVIVRFSQIALYSVVLLAVSGTIMAILIVGSVDTLVGTGYGRTLLLKLGIVAAVIALSAWNRSRLLPRIAQKPTVALQWVSLRRILSYEAALLVAVIVVTGFLTNASPAHDSHHDAAGGSSAVPAVQGLDIQIESQGLTVDGRLTPIIAGQSTLTFRLEFDGEAVTPEQVSVDARLPAQELGPFSAVPELDPVTGAYLAVLTLPAPGEWQIQVTARISTYDQPIVIIPVTIP